MSTSEKRIAPWVGYMSLYGREGPACGSSIRKEQGGDCHFPVVVTPLMPDDPKVGEVWVGNPSKTVKTITSAPWVSSNGTIKVAHNRGFDSITILHPKPKGHTYRIRGTEIRLDAENKEEAAAQLVDSLIEEVK